LTDIASNEFTHMNRHSYTAVKVNSKVAMVSAGLTSVSPSARYCSQVDGDTGETIETQTWMG